MTSMDAYVDGQLSHRVDLSYEPNGRTASVDFFGSSVYWGSQREMPDPNGLPRPREIVSGWWDDVVNPVNWTETWTTGTYAYDGSGNVKSVTRTGAPSKQYAYDRWSRLTSYAEDGAEVRGYSYDDVGNLTGILPSASDEHYFMHARYYSSGMGRFLSVDPVGGEVGSSQSWNRYSYVVNNPMTLVDPEGEAAHVAIGALVGAAVGGGLEVIRQYRAGEGWNIAKIGTEAGQGMAVGAVAAATGGAPLLVAAGGVGVTTAVTGMAGRALDMDAQTDALDGVQVTADLAGGALGGGAGLKAGQLVTRAVAGSQTQRVAARQADTWVRRVAARSPSRQAAAVANAERVASRPAQLGRLAAGATRGATATGVSAGVRATHQLVSSHEPTSIEMVSCH